MIYIVQFLTISRRTALAIECAYELTKRGRWFGLWWVNASSSTCLKQSYREIALVAKLPGADDPNINLLGLVSAWLEADDSGNWMMVLDDIDNTSDFFDMNVAQIPRGTEEVAYTESLPFCLPRKAGGSVLVTSRYRNAAIRLAGHENCILEIGLNRKEEVRLLFAKTGPNSQLDQMDECSNRDQGRFKEGAQLDFNPLDRRIMMPGLGERCTFVASYNLSIIFRNQGREDNTEELGVQVLTTRLEMMGEEPLETLNMSDYALTCFCQGKWKEAEEFELLVMESRKELFGLYHLSTLASMSNVALILGGQKRWEEAEQMQLKVMEITNELLGPDHPGTAVSMANLAFTYGKQGRWHEAQVLGVQVENSRYNMMGAKHPGAFISVFYLVCKFKNEKRSNEEDNSESLVNINQMVVEAKYLETLLKIKRLAFIENGEVRWKLWKLINSKTSGDPSDPTMNPFEATQPTPNVDLRAGSGVDLTDLVKMNRKGLIFIDHDQTDGFHREVIVEEHVYNFFVQNSDLRPLYEGALRRMDRNQFINNFRELLGQYTIDLTTQATTDTDRLIIRSLDSEMRVRIAQRIPSWFVAEYEEIRTQMRDRMLEMKEETPKLNAWITVNADLGSQKSTLRSATLENHSIGNDEGMCDNNENKDANRDHSRPSVAEISDFLAQGHPFQTLSDNLEILLLPNTLGPLARVLKSVPSDRIWFSTKNDFSPSNRTKSLIEDHTEENWNWWPLRPRMRLLQNHQTRLHWRCVSILRARLFGVNLLISE